MSAAASWLLAALWISILALAELAVILAAFHLPKTFPRVVGYLRSVVDDPNWPGKMSASRSLALIAVVDAVWTVAQLIRYITNATATVGIATVVAGVITTLTALAASFVLRKKSDGSTEPVDDVRQTQERAAAQTKITVENKTGAGQ